MRMADDKQTDPASRVRLATRTRGVVPEVHSGTGDFVVDVGQTAGGVIRSRSMAGSASGW